MASGSAGVYSHRLAAPTARGGFRTISRARARAIAYANRGSNGGLAYYHY